MKIVDLPSSGTVKGIYYVKEVTYSNDAHNNVIVSIDLADNSGNVKAKILNPTKEQTDALKEKICISINGDMAGVNTSPYLKITKFDVLYYSKRQLQDEFNVDVVDSVALYEILLTYIAKLQQEQVKSMLSSYITEIKEQLLVSPAAVKIHHEYKGGLLEHIVSMLKLAETMCGLYPYLNTDLMYGGIIIHDLGKIVEYSTTTKEGYISLEGKMIGHISLMLPILDQLLTKYNVPQPYQVALKHILLAHHGRLEFGSPVLPCIAEAEAISLIDTIDYKMNYLEKSLLEAGPDNLTKKLTPLDNRTFYKFN